MVRFLSRIADVFFIAIPIIAIADVSFSLTSPPHVHMDLKARCSLITHLFISSGIAAKKLTFYDAVLPCVYPHVRGEVPISFV